MIPLGFLPAGAAGTAAGGGRLCGLSFLGRTWPWGRCATFPGWLQPVFQRHRQGWDPLGGLPKEPAASLRHRWLHVQQRVWDLPLQQVRFAGNPTEAARYGIGVRVAAPSPKGGLCRGKCGLAPRCWHCQQGGDNCSAQFLTQVYFLLGSTEQT